LAEISLLLETQDAPVEFTESFARFKADFCLFLLQMEAEDPLYSKKLGTLSLQNYLSTTETAPAENRESDAPVSWEVEEAEPSAPAPKGPRPFSPLANEYAALARYFENCQAAPPPGIPHTHWTRLIALSTTASIEVELQDCAQTFLAPFWQNRQTYVAQVWDPKNPRAEFHPAIVSFWNQLKPSYWPAQEPLPFSTFKNSLRFLAAHTHAQPPQPSLLELGLWLFLFGQSRDLGGIKLQNVWNLPDFTSDTLADFFLRLCRVHRIKQILQNPLSAFAPALRDELQEHSETIFSFTEKWRGHTK
jgi:hypothetical protein